MLTLIKLADTIAKKSIKSSLLNVLIPRDNSRIGQIAALTSIKIQQAWGNKRLIFTFARKLKVKL